MILFNMLYWCIFLISMSKKVIDFNQNQKFDLALILKVVQLLFLSSHFIIASQSE